LGQGIFVVEVLTVVEAKLSGDIGVDLSELLGVHLCLAFFLITFLTILLLVIFLSLLSLLFLLFLLLVRTAGVAARFRAVARFGALARTGAVA